MTARNNTENLKHTKFEPQNLIFRPPHDPKLKNLGLQELSYGHFFSIQKYGTSERFSAIPMVRCNIVYNSQVGYNTIPFTAFGHLKHKKSDIKEFCFELLSTTQLITSARQTCKYNITNISKQSMVQTGP